MSQQVRPDQIHLLVWHEYGMMALVGSAGDDIRLLELSSVGGMILKRSVEWDVWRGQYLTIKRKNSRSAGGRKCLSKRVLFGISNKKVSK